MRRRETELRLVLSLFRRTSVSFSLIENPYVLSLSNRNSISLPHRCYIHSMKEREVELRLERDMTYEYTMRDRGTMRKRQNYD